MRIICPACASHYEVEAARLAKQGQLVRCARCREVWLVLSPGSGRERSGGPDSAAPAQQNNVPRPPEVIDFQAAKGRLRPPDAKTWSRTRATSLTVLLVGALAVGGAGMLRPARTAVAARSPLAAKLFAAVGLPTDVATLALRDVRSVLVEEGNGTVLTLQGTIANLGDGPAPVPNLTMVVRSQTNVPLYTWTSAPPKPVLARGEAVSFRSRLDSPPPAGRDVRVSFAGPGRV